jgi:putative mRNA 3-end processing factor
MSLISFTDHGLYCSAGDFYIDPWRPVDHAVITHAHSDHARWGSAHYLCHEDTLPVLRLRLGNINAQPIAWGDPVYKNGVKISLHPAGHIIGSSQIRVEHKGEVCVVSGDYKTEADGLSGNFEAIPCHTFITESTFALPIYQWEAQPKMFDSIGQWISNNQQNNTVSILIAYSLGKAQRLLQAITPVTDHIFVHGAIWNTHKVLQDHGIPLPDVQRVTPDIPKSSYNKSVVIAPPGATESSWMKKFQPYKTAVCSGWMQVRGNFRRNNTDAGFALSDHADWKGLISAIEATGASKVFVTHGFQSVLSRYLNEKGIEAAEVKTAYGEEDPLLTENPDQS